ncbi:uncharacterized protein Nmag_2053 [Natrialba magadii ATCC 43099]|uniref:Uncharacterized protein n=1 Tax=Natrialba magadii (strain ATCC 43099 / DSM 3394 / CCM 3739 / CIP 104546 / IAM 13178 / JCM 8861 / NBRC 102185 / NCIMB 2190 / MS3) TaxID=547559 RepID=D3SVL5_NATMM|nr:hypothetical protein [Natrialba magadii]ADD05623.1 uncharacterized protein Nmag_2053 [Natrialba magadii ATCC 43099]ELY29964.1 hypothetical protein C500_10149 [Natrialba magadii ATCC 43099]
MDDADLPPEWAVHTARAYTPAQSERERQYRLDNHSTSDLRLKVAPASLDGDDQPGYALTVTSYPELECSERHQVRTVLTFERCDELARRFMVLFSTQYDGAGSLAAAREYAAVRTRSHR